MLCEKCKVEMNYFREGQCCGWACPKCGDDVVTSYFDPIQLDNQTYTLTLIPNSNATVEDYKILSKAGNLSLINAKKKAESGELIAEGRATEIKKCYDLLKTSSLAFEITPEFPYRD